jgi:gliding motility-associated-like protein
VVASGTNSGDIALAVGANTIKVVVTSADGTSTTNYNIVVYRTVTSTTLSSLGLSAGTVSPAFAPGTGTYTASVSNDTKTITLTPGLTDNSAVALIKVNGLIVNNGETSAPVELATGNNEISITVTALDGSATSNYTLTVNRALSSDATLSSLALEGAALLPAFSSAESVYSAKVGNATTRINVIPIGTDGHATLTLNGLPVTGASGVDLAIGDNIITVVLTAEDGITTKTYTVSVNRATISADATLASLGLNAGALSPGFEAGINNYDVSLPPSVSSLSITPAASQAGAAVMVNGTVLAGGASIAVPLNGASTSVSIQVTAADGTTVNTYTLLVDQSLPRITAINPAKAAAGQTITISGSGFSTAITENYVFFGSLRALVTASSTGSLSVKVPAGATYAPVSVLNIAKARTAWSSVPFIMAFSPSKKGLSSYDFSSKQDFSTGDLPRASVAADFDGDGKMDIAVSNYPAFTVTIYLNNSSGSTVTLNKLNFNTDKGPADLAAADLDGDGRIDLIAVNQGANTISVLRNTGSPGSVSFAPQVQFAVGTQPQSVTIADFDGDGRADVATASLYTKFVSVLRNSGSPGTIAFEPFKGINTTARPYFITSGDLDGNGKPELAVANIDANNVSVYRNSSSGSSINFDSPLTFATVDGPQSLVIGDMDGDGKPDLAAGSDEGLVSVLHNSGTSAISFNARVDLTAAMNMWELQLADFNGDGRPDLAGVSYSEKAISIFNNTSSPGSLSFARRVSMQVGAGPFSLYVADINGDNRPDLVSTNFSSNNISVVLNNLVLSKVATLTGLSVSAGVLSPAFAPGTTAYTVLAPYLTPSTTVSPVASDPSATIRVNGVVVSSGDTSGDITLRTGLNTIAVSVTAEDGSTTVNYTISIIIRAVLSSDASLLLLNLSAGTLLPEFESAITDYSTTVPFLTSSMIITRVVSHINASIQINGVPVSNGSFSSSIPLSPGPNTISILVTAQDGIHTRTYTVTVNRQAFIEPPVITSFSPASGAVGTEITVLGRNFNVAATDNVVYFGSTRAIVTSASANSLTVKVPLGASYKPISVLNTSTNLTGLSSNLFLPVFASSSKELTAANFSPRQAYPNTSSYQVAGGDLDGDGKPDLAALNSKESSLRILRNTSRKGSSSFAATDFATIEQPGSLTLADLDGDGKMDLSVINAFGELAVLLNKSTPGNMDFQDVYRATTLVNVNTVKSIAFGDLNGDGLMDIVIAGSNFDYVSVFLNRSTPGNISFAAREDISAAHASFVTIADLDGDGRQEIITAYEGISVLRNTASAGEPPVFVPDFSVNLDMGRISALILTDIDTDGKADLAAGGEDGKATLLFNSSTPGHIDFTGRQVLADRPESYSGASGDLNGDGKPDLAFSHKTYEDISIFKNISGDKPGFAKYSIDSLFNFSDTYSTIIEDIDGDEKPDLILTNASGTLYNGIVVFLNQVPLNSQLSALALSNAVIAPVFSSSVLNYTASVANTVSSTQVISVASNQNAVIRVNGAIVASGSYSADIPLHAGRNEILVEVIEDDLTSAVYTITITRASINPEITFIPLNTITYGDADLNPGATSSNLIDPVVYTSSNPEIAFIISGKIHNVKPGTTTITASQAGGTISKSILLTVIPKPLTVSIAATPVISKVYDGNTQANLLPANYILTGIVRGDQPSVNSSAAYIDKTAGVGKMVNIRSFVLSGDQKDNYTLSNVPITATGDIIKRELTVTADNKSKLEGSSNPDLTFTYSGFLDGENQSYLSMHAVALTTAEADSPAGVYPITVGGATADNYTFDYIAGTLTITLEPFTFAQNVLYENQPKGIQFGTFSSLSNTRGGSFVYTLVRGLGDTDNDLFTITGNSLITATSLNYEEKAIYSILVRKTSESGGFIDQQFAVLLSDVNEAPAMSELKDQRICYTTIEQTIPVYNISGGPETGQTVTVSISALNPNLFDRLSISKVTNGTAFITYRLRSGALGSTDITISLKDDGGTKNEGVDTFSASFLLTVDAMPSGTVVSDRGTTITEGTIVTLSAAGGVSYTWATSTGVIPGQNESRLTVNPVVTTTYIVTIANASGCSVEERITVNVTGSKPNNIITPNGDGKNDTWVIEDLGSFRKKDVKVFDKTGRVVFRQLNYNNDWDGSSGGRPLNEDTYYYIIDYGSGYFKNGFVDIVR